jgi:group I intron endonuclease
MKKQDNVIIGIYKIINPKNKVYIGKSNDIERRKTQYCRVNSSSLGYKIKFSIKKYGWENHIFEIIEECTLEQLDEREIYWIKTYDSVKNGLNIGKGGEGGNMTSYTKNKISNTWKSKSKNELDIINQKRSQGNLGKKKPKSGYRNWKEIDLKRLKNNNPFLKTDWSEKCKKPVLMMDKNNNILKRFNSVTEAANFIKVSQATLSGCLTGKSKTSGGYKWKFE